MNAAEIIMETIEYYGADPANKRGVRHGTREARRSDGGYDTLPTQTCEYAVTNGETKYCAVGRCLSEEAKIWVVDVAGDISDLIQRWWNSNNSGDPAYDMEEDEEFYLDEMMAEEYQGQTRRFWDDLQGIHDTHTNWSEAPNLCLTQTGFKQVEALAGNHMFDEDKRKAFMNKVATRSEQ